MDGWMNRERYGWMDELGEIWMDEERYGWMDEWGEKWMDG